MRCNISIQSDDIPVNRQYVDSIVKTGVTLLSKTRWLNGVVISTMDSTKIAKIKNFPFVFSMKRIQGSFSKKSQANKFEEPFYPNEKTVGVNAATKVNSYYNYGGSFSQVNMLGGVDLHDKGAIGQGVVLAVLDGGFRDVNSLAAFDSIRKNKQILGTWDFVSRDSLVYDDDPHGMNALSTIAGNLPGQLVGSAPKASFWLLRSEDAASEYIGEEYYWVAAAEFADSVGADIISSSLGYNTFDDPTQNHTYAMMNGHTTPIAMGANRAAAKGLLVVVSAGNEGNSSWIKIISPADADSVIAVGSVNASKAKSSFSSFGPSFDQRVKPDVAAQGEGVVVASLTGGTQLANGTSFSCPILAGMAACILQDNPEMCATDLLQAIRKSGDHYRAPDSLTGYGIPDFFQIYSSLETFTVNLPITRVNPNPFHEKIEIVFYSQSSGPLSIDLYDAMAQVSFHSIENTIGGVPNEIKLLGLESLRKGLYILRLASGHKIQVFKLIKI
jgi:serine protease AprX